MVSHSARDEGFGFLKNQLCRSCLRKGKFLTTGQYRHAPLKCEG
jgi:hypothetical protein